MPSRRRRTTKRPSLRSVRQEIRRSAKIISQRDLVNAWRKSPLHKLQIKPLDRHFIIVKKEAVLKYLEYSHIDKKRYVAEYFDCDDFASALRGEARLKLSLNSVGEVVDYSGGHAYSVIAYRDVTNLNDTIKFMVVEPQSDGEITRARVGRGMYKATRGFVLF